MKSARAPAFLGALLFVGNAIADGAVSPVSPEVAQVVTPEGWTFASAPYFWMAGLSGDFGSFGLPAITVDASFSDIIDHLDFGAMAITEARLGA